jgi:hypothetical protein
MDDVASLDEGAIDEQAVISITQMRLTVKFLGRLLVFCEGICTSDR